jgi:hypothetical protein
MGNVKNYHVQGGIKWIIGGELEIEKGGKLTFQGKELKPAANQSDSEATTIDALKDDFNTLLVKLKSAGLMKSG